MLETLCSFLREISGGRERLIEDAETHKTVDRSRCAASYCSGAARTAHCERRPYRRGYSQRCGQQFGRAGGSAGVQCGQCRSLSQCAGAAAGRGARRILGGSGQQRRERGRKCVHVRSSRFVGGFEPRRFFEAHSTFVGFVGFVGGFEPRRFFEAHSAFGGFVPCVVVLACGGVVSCSVVFDIGLGLVWQLAYNGDHGCKDQCVCAAAPEPAKTQQQKTVSDRKQCVQ